jgi:transaldolase/glucose-6-phosphate isomerase
MRIALGSDHAGFELKDAIRASLIEEHYEVLDLGTSGPRPVDYPDYAEAVGTALRERRADRGILVCGSGVGASMAANRIPGVRAGLCHDPYSARQGVQHDDMNVLVLGGRVVGIELARELVRAFLSAHFTGEPRHVRRLGKVIALENPLRALELFGQSIWLDNIRRSLLTGGELGRLIDEDGLRGVTSNPAIFEKAIAGSSDYRDIIAAPESHALGARLLYERLAIRDIQDASDALAPVYRDTGRRDGYLSLEVSPDLAFDTAGTLAEARRLWRAVGRENLMIKIPATPEGIDAVRDLIAEGINVNVTLLFAREAYEHAAEAYIQGLERLVAGGGDPARVASVASFFISRIDTAVDALIEERVEASTDPAQRALLRGCSGRVAIANAKLAYQRYRELFSGPRWQALVMRGAQTQRLLWASTGTKNPRLRDVFYVEELIGPETVNTLPPQTLDAFREHGRPRASLTEDLDAAFDTIDRLGRAGISLAAVADRLLADGVRLFSEAFAKLLAAVEQQRRGARRKRIDRLAWSLPADLQARVTASIDEWRVHGKLRRLWARDPSLWTGKDEGQWLGWLGVTNGQLAHLERLTGICEAARTSGFSDVLLLGMGGSSLGPDVMRKTFGRIDGFPELHVLDSTDPAQVAAFEGKLDLARTAFIVSSKSGSTLEPHILMRYFFARVAAAVGEGEAGRQFIAITDPGSALQHEAERLGFRRVFFGWPSIGGRYSVLSDFGLVPAAIMGVDVAKLLDRTDEMVSACMPSVPIDENPGVVLGTILGVAAGAFGRDKMTIVAPPALEALGGWLEQLVAESTGKEGKGIIPVDGEPLGAPAIYGADRIFVYLTLSSDPAPALDASVGELERAGQPVVRIALDDRYDLGESFFLWEMATAVAGSILGVHPFDQPDVEASKVATRKLTNAYDETGSFPAETPVFSGEGVRLFTDAANAGVLDEWTRNNRTLEGYLDAHVNRLREGDYFAILAFIPMNEAHQRALQSIRLGVRDARRIATGVEFGPRFLHSTGQAYKGGPGTGVFLQITCDDAADLPVPGARFSFGMVKAAQARGDLEVLLERKRRALRVHLGPDVEAGLASLQRAMHALHVR